MTIDRQFRFIQHPETPAWEAVGWRHDDDGDDQIVVIRFTGREINADARQCADEVLSMVMDFQTRRIEMAMEGVD